MKTGPKKIKVKCLREALKIELTENYQEWKRKAKELSVKSLLYNFANELIKLAKGLSFYKKRGKKK
jgi:hypothetical protein